MISTATAVVIAKAGLAPSSSQNDERGRRQGEHDGHEDGGHAIGQALHRRLAGLSLAHEAPDLRQRGVGADLRRAHDETPSDVDGATGDLVAGVLLDGDRLARQECLIDCGRPLLDNAVGGDLLAGPHDEPVTDAQLVDRDAPLAAVGAEHRHVLGAELEQRPRAPHPSAAWRAPRGSGRAA